MASIQVGLYLPNLPRETKEVKFEDGFDIVASGGAGNSPQTLLTNLSSFRRKTNAILLHLPTGPTVSNDPHEAAREYLSHLIGLHEAPEPAVPEETAAAKEGGGEGEGQKKAAAEAEEEKKKKEDDKKGKDKKGKGKEKEEPAKPIPLSRAIAFSWTDFHRKNKKAAIGGADTEVYATLLNLGLWTLVLAKKTVEIALGSEADARQKEAYKTFCKASGVFAALGSKVVDKADDLTDHRANVAKALASLALALAQCITIDRAETSNHSEQLVSGLARDTAEKFQLARDTLTSPNPTPNPEVHDKFLSYLDFMRDLYFAKAYFHHGNHLANPEATEAGKALKAFQTAVEKLATAKSFLVAFADDLEPARATSSKAYFDELQKQYEAMLAKMKKQNDMVYHEKIPDEAAQLPEAKSTVEAVEYSYPEKDKKWTPELYAALKAKQDAVADADKTPSTGCCSIM